MQKSSNIYVRKGCKYTSAAVSVSCIVIKKNLQISHTNTDAVARRCSVKKVFLEISQNSQGSICTRVSVLIKLQASGLQQVFSCEFCEISKNTFSNRTPLVAASANTILFKDFSTNTLYLKHISDSLQLSQNKPIWKYIPLPKTSLD